MAAGWAWGRAIGTGMALVTLLCAGGVARAQESPPVGAELASKDLDLPRQWLMVGFRLSNLRDVLDVRYHFDPERLEIDWDEASAVALRSVQAGAEEDAGIDINDPIVLRLAEWLGDMREPVRLGFYNGLAGVGPIRMPWADNPGGLPPAVALRLAELDELREKGAISEADYDAQNELIRFAVVEVAEEQMSNETLTLIKVVAEQATAAVPLYLGNLIVLGSMPQAAALLGIQTAVDFVHDYGVEWLWNAYGPQRLREAPTIDFPGAGAII